MAHAQRPRRYVSPLLLMMLRPVMRRSETRDAYILRLVGNRWGPVLRYDRRRSRAPFDGIERRLAEATQPVQ